MTSSQLNCAPSMDSVFLLRLTLLVLTECLSNVAAQPNKMTTVLAKNSRARELRQQESSSVERLLGNAMYSGEYTDAKSSAESDDGRPKLSKPPHQLCDADNSGGKENEDLEWSEPAYKIFPVLDDYQMYNVFVPPGAIYGETTNVSVAIYIESMSSFKAQTMDFEVDMYLAMMWLDRRLAHNCTHPILVTDMVTANRIWHPDLYFVNSKFAYLQEVTTPNFMVLIYPDGVVFKSMR